MTSETAVLIYPIHLFENLTPILSKSKQLKYKYYLLEEPLYFSSEERVVRFNGLKLLLHRVSMKIYQDNKKGSISGAFFFLLSSSNNT